MAGRACATGPAGTARPPVDGVVGAGARVGQAQQAQQLGGKLVARGAAERPGDEGGVGQALENGGLGYGDAERAGRAQHGSGPAQEKQGGMQGV